MTNASDATVQYKTTSFRAEASLIESARKIFDAYELSVNAAITLFLEACVRQGRIPETVLSQGNSPVNSEFVDAVLRSVAENVGLPDFGDPMVSANDFADEIVLEFTDSIFADTHDPWWDKARKVLELSSWKPQFVDGDDDDDDAWFYESLELLEEFVPEKLPYDYAREIVEAETKAWAKAERDAGVELDNPFDVIMGSMLKRSHLTLDSLMERLVEADAVEDKDGDNFNRSMGRMVENLVAYLKENGCWDAPEQKEGIPFKEVNEGLVDEVIDGDVAFRVGCDCTSYLAYEHPIGYMFEDVAVTMNSAIEGAYTSLFNVDEFDVADAFGDAAKLDETLCFLFDNCEFKFPPKIVYDECRRRYLDAMESAEPGTVAAKCLPYAKAPFDYERAYIYPISIDMDAEVWAEVYNREAFLTTVRAVESGKLPRLG